MDKIILFTKAPNENNCKTRLSPFLSCKERLELMKKLIKQNYDIAKLTNFDIVIYYDGNKDDLSFLEEKKKPQEGDYLGYRMKNAIFDELDSNNRVVLMGTDLENLSSLDIEEAFSKLDKYDIVISPTTDGGFGLIGMKEKIDIFTDITYSTPTVYSEIIEKINNFNKKYFALPTIRDIDNMKDLVVAEFNDDNVENLGSGEYNLNYKLDDKVIRINLASQIGLGKKQLKYEYDSLKILEKSNSTPKVYDYYEKGKYLSKSFLTMQYIEGRPLDYSTDMQIAAKLLSSVHNLKADYGHFIYAKKPFSDMYDEFISMFSRYESYYNKDLEIENRIIKLLKIAKESGLDSKITKPCIINTELNNRNFIIGNKSVIIDWEKPIIGECEQDLAHFLAPTTTNWKTDTILSENEILDFLNSYEKYRKVDYGKFYKYLMFNVLRGLTWCSMAKIEYEEGRFINNPETYKKINKFLSKDFLDTVEVYFRRYDG